MPLLTGSDKGGILCAHEASTTTGIDEVVESDLFFASKAGLVDDASRTPAWRNIGSGARSKLDRAGPTAEHAWTATKEGLKQRGVRFWLWGSVCGRRGGVEYNVSDASLFVYMDTGSGGVLEENVVEL